MTQLDGRPVGALRGLQWLLGPLLVLLAAGAVEALDRSGWTAGSVAPVLLAVTLASYVWGLRSGLVGAAVMGVYTFFAFGGPSLEFPTVETMRRAVWATVTGFAIAATVGTLRAREARAREIASRAERAHAEAAEAAARTLAEANAALTATNAALAESNRALEGFSYTVAHDLRTPLRGVEALTRFTLKDHGHRMPAEAREQLEIALASAERMSRLVDDLLHFSRAAKGDLRAESIDLSALAREAAAEVRERHPERRVAFACHEGEARVRGDARLLRLVLVNLLDNAWKYTREREPHARVEFGVRRLDGGEAAFFVRDNGAGFDPARGGDLFREFSRLHDWNEYPGTGVGLATVRRIVERHGGRVWAEGRPKEGATFHFTIGDVATLAPSPGGAEGDGDAVSARAARAGEARVAPERAA